MTIESFRRALAEERQRRPRFGDPSVAVMHTISAAAMLRDLCVSYRMVDVDAGLVGRLAVVCGIDVFVNDELPLGAVVWGYR